MYIKKRASCSSMKQDTLLHRFDVLIHFIMHWEMSIDFWEFRQTQNVQIELLESP